SLPSTAHRHTQHTICFLFVDSRRTAARRHPHGISSSSLPLFLTSRVPFVLRRRRDVDFLSHRESPGAPAQSAVARCPGPVGNRPSALAPHPLTASTRRWSCRKWNQWRRRLEYQCRCSGSCFVSLPLFR
ncbi:hypothetical protein HAX54_038116, partial [Datura stramonium]|nr:hypothetical protein [Datura stramonium]